VGQAVQVRFLPFPPSLPSSTPSSVCAVCRVGCLYLPPSLRSFLCLCPVCRMLWKMRERRVYEDFKSAAKGRDSVYLAAAHDCLWCIRELGRVKRDRATRKTNMRDGWANSLFLRICENIRRRVNHPPIVRLSSANYPRDSNLNSSRMLKAIMHGQFTELFTF